MATLLRRSALLACFTTLALALSVAPALASHEFGFAFGSPGAGSGQFSTSMIGDSPDAVAVDQSSHDVYAVDEENHRVEKFDASGSFILMFGRKVNKTQVEAAGSTEGEQDVCTAASGDTCQAGEKPEAGQLGFDKPWFVAVDNSGGASAGDVYVFDEASPSDELVWKFSPEGDVVAGWGDHTPGPNGSLSGTGATAPIAGPFGEGTLDGIAVDQLGDLWVYAEKEALGRGVMYEFGQEGSFITDWNSQTRTANRGIAVDSEGNLYVVNPKLGVTKLTSAGAVIGDVNDEYQNISGLAVDPVTDDLYVDDRERIDRYEHCNPAAGECTPADSFGLGDLTPGHTRTGVAVDPETRIVYAGDPGASRVVAFVPPPAGPPSIDATSATMPTESTAAIAARVNPGGEDTTCVVQWGTSTSYGSEVPCEPADLGAGKSDVAVTAKLSGLQPNVTYHYRIIASNALSPAGGTAGPDHTFGFPLPFGPGGCPANEQRRIEDRSTMLPDCRAYEMVTPIFKSGQLVAVPKNLAGESNLLFDTLGAPGNPGDNPGADGSTYLATRTASGWSATPLDPPASLVNTEGLIQESFLDASVDLRSALFEETPASSSKQVDHRFYLRRTDGSLAEVGPTVPAAAVASWTPAIEEPSNHLPFLGASPDLSRLVFFQSPTSKGFWFWPGDATLANQTLYEYTRADSASASEPVLVGVGPGPREAEDLPSQHPVLASQCGTYLGGINLPDGQGYDGNAISSPDGSTVFVTVLPASACGGSGPPAVEIFARIEGGGPGAHTVAISEPSAADCSACVTTSPQDAIYQGAAADGSRVFFLSTQKLFGGANGEAATNLYAYDFNAPAGEKLSFIAPGLVESAGRAGGIAAVAENGSHVYFVSGAVLASNPDPRGNPPQLGADNLYAYDSETAQTSFVAALASADSADWSADFGQAHKTETTPDGRFLLFTSAADPTPGSAGGASQLYRYDAQTGGLIRISIGEGGVDDNGNVEYDNASIVKGNAGFASPRSTGLSISDDGSYVFFTSVAALTRGAQDNLPSGSNVYEYHAGHVYLLSDGSDHRIVLGGAATQLIGASPSGRDVYFRTAASLLPQDTDGQTDIYDARIEGGFPVPPAAVDCAAQDAGEGAVRERGEACQGARAPAPSSTPQGSSTFFGPGNLLAPLPTPVKPAPKKRLTRAQKLARALKACRSKHNKRKRAACKRRAHRLYGPKTKKKARHPKKAKSKRRGK